MEFVRVLSFLTLFFHKLVIFRRNEPYFLLINNGYLFAPTCVFVVIYMPLDVYKYMSMEWVTWKWSRMGEK